MSKFLAAYLKHGMKQIIVVERKVDADRFGRDELCAEKVAARKGNKFVLATFYAKRGFLIETCYDDSSTYWEPITEDQYRSLIKGKRRIDTPKAMRDLENGNHVPKNKA